MRHHSHYLCPHTHLIDNITSILCMTSHSPYMWHRLHHTRHHILTLWPQTTVFSSSHPLFWTSSPLYPCHHLHCIDDITTTVSLRSHPLWLMISYPFYTTWKPLYDITTTAFMTSDSLHMTSPAGFMTSHPLYLWHHRHYVCEYMSSIFNIKHRVLRQHNHYIWNHNLHMCICVIIDTLSML